MLAFPATRLIKISTPYMKSGVLYEDFRRYFGQDSPDVLVWPSPPWSPRASESRIPFKISESNDGQIKEFAMAARASFLKASTS